MAEAKRYISRNYQEKNYERVGGDLLWDRRMRCPCLNFEEAFVDPHNKYRGIFPEAFNIIQPKPAPDLSVTPAPKITDKHKIKLTEAELFSQWGIN